LAQALCSSGASCSLFAFFREVWPACEMMPVCQLVFAVFVATAVQQVAAATTTMKSTSKKMMTTTSGMAMVTTTTTIAGADTVYTGSMTLQLADAQAFVDSPNATTIMAHSIAASNDDINQDMVDVSSVALATRRLSAEPRGLAAGGVKVDYTVTYPPAFPNPVFTKASIDTTKLTEAIKAKATTLGLNVTVTGVVVAEPVQTSGPATTATTGTSTSGATAATGLLALVSAVVMTALAA